MSVEALLASLVAFGFAIVGALSAFNYFKDGIKPVSYADRLQLFECCVLNPTAIYFLIAVFGLGIRPVTLISVIGWSFMIPVIMMFMLVNSYIEGQKLQERIIRELGDSVVRGD
jgi:hypothetical protein